MKNGPFHPINKIDFHEKPIFTNRNIVIKNLQTFQENEQKINYEIDKPQKSNIKKLSQISIILSQFYWLKEFQLFNQNPFSLLIAENDPSYWN